MVVSLVVDVFPLGGFDLIVHCMRRRTVSLATEEGLSKFGERE